VFIPGCACPSKGVASPAEPKGPGEALSDSAPMESEGKCPVCLATFGMSLRDKSEDALYRVGFRAIRITCGSCFAKLIATIDQVGRLSLTEDKTSFSGEVPIVTAQSPRGREVEA